MHCEYVCVYYADDLAVMTKDPSSFFAELRDRKYKLKGVGKISYHLGGDFYRDPNGTLAWDPRLTVNASSTNANPSLVRRQKNTHPLLTKMITRNSIPLKKQVLKTSNTTEALLDLSDG